MPLAFDWSVAGPILGPPDVHRHRRGSALDPLTAATLGGQLAPMDPLTAASVLDVGSLESGAPYMVLEYLEGSDLSNFPRSQLSVGGIIDLVLQACEALAEAHSLGIIHRDIWALGVVLYKLLQGAPPFSGDTFSSILLKVMTEPLPQLTVQLPGELAAIVYRCLEKDPARRFQNVAELALALAPYAQTETQASISVRRTRSILGLEAHRSASDPGPARRAISPSTLSGAAGARTTPMSSGRRWPIFAALSVLAGVVAIAIVASNGGGSGDGKKPDGLTPAARPDTAPPPPLAAMTGGSTTPAPASTATAIPASTATATPASTATATPASTATARSGSATRRRPTTVTVTFNESADTSFGQNIFVTGSIKELVSWSAANAVPLTRLSGSGTRGNWRVILTLPAGTSVEYKYVKKDGAGTVIWESGANRVATTGTGSSTQTVSDSWK